MPRNWWRRACALKGGIMLAEIAGVQATPAVIVAFWSETSAILPGCQIRLLPAAPSLLRCAVYLAARQNVCTNNARRAEPDAR